MIKIDQGTYTIGTDFREGFSADCEGPKVTLHTDAYYIDETTVTNEAFLKFVEDTGYVTEAEQFGWSFVFHYFLTEDIKSISKSVPNLAWWFAVDGATFRSPEGPGSDILSRMSHPVVHVSRNDAVAYCQWAGKRLPSEAEWEIAAKGGTTFTKYPWGESLLRDGQHQCNIWQGDFPLENTQEDGFSDTAPAKYYEPNGYGLYQMIGNVWEWCSNYARIPTQAFTKKDGKTFWMLNQEKNDHLYAMRGGSFLCHHTYCKRYRISARNGNSGMSSSNNIGFRCVKDV